VATLSDYLDQLAIAEDQASLQAIKTLFHGTLRFVTSIFGNSFL